MTSHVILFPANEKCISTLPKNIFKIGKIIPIFSGPSVFPCGEIYFGIIDAGFLFHPHALEKCKCFGEKYSANLMSSFLTACSKAACFNFLFDEVMFENHDL